MFRCFKDAAYNAVIFTICVVTETYNQNTETAQYAHFNPEKRRPRTRQGQLKANETNVVQLSRYSVLLRSALLDTKVGKCYQFNTAFLGKFYHTDLKFPIETEISRCGVCTHLPFGAY
jgi:hypothetical protein